MICFLKDVDWIFSYSFKNVTLICSLEWERSGESVPNTPGIAQDPQWPYLCCSLKPVLYRAVPRAVTLATAVSCWHATPSRVPGLRPRKLQKAKVPHFFPAQENPAKLSDQQEAVSQGQNPYSIYASVNVRTNISGEDFAGAWVWGPGSRWR